MKQQDAVRRVAAMLERKWKWIFRALGCAYGLVMAMVFAALGVGFGWFEAAPLAWALVPVNFVAGFLLIELAFRGILWAATVAALKG